MNKLELKINREELHKLYMKEVETICDECDWVTSFGPEDIVCIIAGIIEKNPGLLNTD